MHTVLNIHLRMLTITNDGDGDGDSYLTILVLNSF